MSGQTPEEQRIRKVEDAVLLIHRDIRVMTENIKLLTENVTRLTSVQADQKEPSLRFELHQKEQTKRNEICMRTIEIFNGSEVQANLEFVSRFRGMVWKIISTLLLMLIGGVTVMVTYITSGGIG